MGGRYRAYSEYKDSGVEWIGEIPELWEQKRVGHHIDFITGFAFKSERFSFDSGIKLVRGDNVTEGMLRWGDKTRYWAEVTKDLKHYLLQDKDILIGMDGSKVGKNYTVVLESDLPLLLVQRVARLRTDDELHYSYLAYLVGSELFRTWTALVKTDPAIPHISPADIKSFPLPFPSKVEQRQIANFLDHETAKIDTLIEKQQQLIKLLKEKRQAVISHAVTKGLNPDAPMKNSGVEWLGEVPERWMVSQIGHCAFVTKLTGFEYTNLWNTSEEGEIITLRGFNVKDRELDLSQTEKISFELSKKLGRSKLSKGNVVFPCTGTIGNAALIESDDKFHINQNIAKICFEESVSPKFAVYWLTSSIIKTVIDRNNMSGMQPVVLIGDIRKLLIPRMSLKEQELITDYLDFEIKKSNKLVGKAQKAINLMQERRTALISAAVTGKVDVRNWQPPEQTQTNKEDVA